MAFTPGAGVMLEVQAFWFKTGFGYNLMLLFGRPREVVLTTSEAIAKAISSTTPGSKTLWLQAYFQGYLLERTHVADDTNPASQNIHICIYI